MKTALDLTEAQARLPRPVRRKETISLRQNDETVAFLLPRDRVEALLETMECKGHTDLPAHCTASTLRCEERVVRCPTGPGFGVEAESRPPTRQGNG